MKARSRDSRSIQRSSATPEREDALEVALAALYGNCPDDEQAFDNLPVPLRERALALSEIFRPRTSVRKACSGMALCAAASVPSLA